MGTALDFNRNFLLLGDIHLNSKDFAACCEEAGADAVIFHINHDGFGGARFGGLELEEDSLKDSLSVLKIPAGLTIGDTKTMLESDWESIVGLGFGFVNMFAHQFPTFVWEDSRVQKVVSIGSGYILEQVKGLSQFESTSGIVAALTPSQAIGTPLTILDVTTLKLIAGLSAKPILLPTQRSIRTSDLDILKEIGCRGLLITTTVYGDTTESCRQKLVSFRELV